MKLLVLNPNSSARVTAAIAEVAASFLERGTYEVHQIDDGPRVIENEAAAHAAAELVPARLAVQRDSFDAFVVACHGDPGVDEARRVTAKPVFGIGAASFRAAAAQAESFGVITLGAALVQRKWRQLIACGLAGRCAAVVPTHTGVLHAVEAESPDLTPYLEAGRRAIGLGASALVLGCAGMAPTARSVERELGVTVIEPVAAGIGEALRASLEVAPA